MILQEAQKLRLNRSRQVADFIQKERSVVAAGNAAGILTDGSGKGSARVTEKLAGQQFRLQCRTRNDSERLGCPRAPAVDCFRQNGFAGSALAPDQDGGFARRHVAGHLQRPLHFQVAGDEHSVGTQAFQVFLQAVQAALDAECLFHLFKNKPELFQCKRLFDVIEGTALHRLHGGIHK